MKQADAARAALKVQTFWAASGIVLAKVADFLKWAVPALLAIACAKWLVEFLRSGNHDASAIMEKLLYVLIGGALGWIASHNKKD